MFTPTAIDPDLATLVSGKAGELESLNRGASVFWWGLNAFRREEKSVEQWCERLREAQELIRTEAAQARSDFTADGPPFVAAVCARDHWTELTAGDREWCVGTLVAVVRRDADTNDFGVVHSGGALDPAGPAAYVLCSLLEQGIDDATRTTIEGTLRIALTHPAHHVVAYALDGIGFFVAAKHPAVMPRYLRILIARAKRDHEIAELRNRRDFFDQREPDDLPESGMRLARALPRNDAPLTAEEFAAFDPADWVGRTLIGDALRMVGHVPRERVARDLFAMVAKALHDSWVRDRDGRDSRDVHLEHDLMGRLAGFAIVLPPREAVELCAPLLDAIVLTTGDVEVFVTKLVIAAVSTDDSKAFWSLWQAFADRLVRAPWAKNIGVRHRRSDDALVGALFLGLHWNEDVRHWRHLEGHAERLDDLFMALPPAAPVFRAYATFLYRIGEKSLPAAFAVLARKLKTADADVVLADGTTVFLLEDMLRRFVYGMPDVVKSDPELRLAVIELLDALVDAGSSAAYRMRDDFVTPRA